MDFGRLDSVGSGLLCDDLLRDLLPPEPGGVSQDPPAPIAPQQLFNPLLGSSSAAPGALNLPQNQPAQPACEANPALGLRVLLVDDDCVVLRVLEQMLRMCQYNVTSCTSGTSAVAILRSQPDGFDLVLCDVMMPDMDGFKLLEIVGLEMDLPVIMISGNGDTETVMRGVTHGAVDYLIKPVRIEELRNMWQHVVRRRLEGEPFGMDSSDDDDAMGIEDELPLEQQGLGPDPLSLPMDMSGISLLHPDMHAPDFPDFSHPEAMMPPSVTTPAAQHAHPEAMMPAPAAAAQHAQHAQHGVMLYPPGQLHPPHMPHHAVPQHAVPQHAVSLPQVQPPVPPPPASSHLQQYQQLQQQHQLQRQQLLQQQAQRQAQVQQPLRQPLHHNHHHHQQQELDEEGLPIAPPPPPPHSTSFKPKAKSSGSKSSKPNSHKKRKDVGSEASEEGSSSKKPRVIWSVEMHQQFVNAVNQLGVDKAVPRKILDLMDIGGLTRENVASHLQKYRLYLKKVDANPNEQFHH